LIACRRGQGLDPLEGELLNDVGPFPLGGKLAGPLIGLLAEDDDLGVLSGGRSVS